MKLYKVDTEAWTVRVVEGEPWPGKDSDGDTCYENTHFESAAKAWKKLGEEVAAEVQLSGRDLITLRGELQTAIERAAAATEAMVRVSDQVREFKRKASAGEEKTA